MLPASNSYSFKLLNRTSLEESLLNRPAREIFKQHVYILYFLGHLSFQGGQGSEGPSQGPQPTCYGCLHFQHALLLAEDVGPIVDDP